MVGHSHLLAKKKHLRSRFWWCIVRNSNLFLPAFCKLWSDIHTFYYPLFANYGWTFTPSCRKTLPLPILMMYSPKFQPFLSRFLQTMVRYSHFLEEKHLLSRFWWFLVGYLHLLFPNFSNLWSDIHTFLQLNTSAPAFDDVWSEIPTF